MSGKRILRLVIALVLSGAVFGSYFVISPLAQAPSPMVRAAGECVTYGSGSALQMCFHKFTDDTRCVAAGGGGLASAGAGVALQCDFK